MTGAPLTDEEIQRIRAAFESIPFARLLDLELTELGRGTATIQMEAREELARNYGIMHGGAIASLADTAAAFAVTSLLEQGQMSLTVDLTIHYLRPVAEGLVRARARVLRAGRRLLTVSVEVSDRQGELIATVLTTYARRS